MRLSVGPSPAAKAITSFAAVILFAGGLCFAGLAFGMGSFFDSWGSFMEDPFAGDPMAPPPMDTPIDEGFSFFGVVAKLIGLCGVPFALGAIYLLLYVWRFQMRLDGTVLTRRGALRTRPGHRRPPARTGRQPDRLLSLRLAVPGGVWLTCG